MQMYYLRLPEIWLQRNNKEVPTQERLIAKSLEIAIPRKTLAKKNQKTQIKKDLSQTSLTKLDLSKNNCKRMNLGEIMSSTQLFRNLLAQCSYPLIRLPSSLFSTTKKSR